MLEVRRIMIIVNSFNTLSQVSAILKAKSQESVVMHLIYSAVTLINIVAILSSYSSEKALRYFRLPFCLLIARNLVVCFDFELERKWRSE